MKHLFFGGIHPKYNKEMSKVVTTLHTIEPDLVVIPMVQHIGAPCTPLVKVGDRVLKGQKIGDGEGLCVPVHASVSGFVKAIEPRPHVRGTNILSVVIANDFKKESVTMPIPDTDDEILHAIREAGIVGMGGAAFPGNVKALGAMGNVDTLIANGCECEPYITADDTLLRTRPEDVIAGMQILYRILKPKRIVLAVEDNKTEAIDKILNSNLLADFADTPIELVILPTRYPQGSEKQLIQAVTGRQVPPGQLPVKVGCAVFNVSTFAAICRAVTEGKPLTERIVTVSGEAIAQPQNFIVPIGTSFHDLIEIAGGLHDKTERVISGGPMMGVAQSDLAVPVIKATNSILCLLKDVNGAAENPVCLRCGKCVSVCPMRLQPLYMYRFTNAGRVDELNRMNLLDCMECGSCAFTCPGKLPLVETFRKGKQMVREAQKK
ncbi:MAG: electron transport complex subunit RsxC [Ruminococcaceae bacterium]|nr:electron transport complex subunit RsxC [Oscillospiraceae bacterium]